MARPTARTFAVILLAACGAPPTPSGAEPPGRHALAIGINKYSHENLKTLKYAVNDAEEMASALSALGFRTTLMTHPAPDDGGAALVPTAENIRARLRELANRAEEGGVALVFFAGHGGQLVENRDGKKRVRTFLFPTDARPVVGRTDTLIDVEDDLFGPLSGAFGNRLLLIDACRDDGIGARSVGYPLPPSASMAALFAAEPGRRSFESDRVRHGVFTHFVLEGLRGRAASTASPGFVTWDSLVGYVKESVHLRGAELLRPGPTEPTGPRESGDFVQRPEYKGTSLGAVTLGPVRRPGAADADGLRLPGGADLALVRVPNGAFRMGALPDDRLAYSNEKPARDVRIDDDFWIGRAPVTRGEFARFVNDTRRPAPEAPPFPQTDDHPVVNVSHADTVAFCEWASRVSGRRVRLPTEAEWEYASRGGEATLYPGGGRLDPESANNPRRRKGTSAIGEFPASPRGLYDMAGNVWEWCEGPPGAREAILRGGSWADDEDDCRCSRRRPIEKTFSSPTIGFRVAVSAD